VGRVGTSTQHSFFQALHQGDHETAADFIGVKQSNHALHDHQRALLANMLAQSEAFALGESNADKQKSYSGNRPNTVFLMDSLTPYSLGMLLAMYEHSVYVQSVCWGINAFDQWGVELGKRLANGILPLLETSSKQASDSVTSAILREL
jgi:glucose-6-phosphate isomerase